MKALKIIVCLIVGCGYQALPQQWYPSLVPRGRDINAIHIFDHSNILLAGGNFRNDSIQAVLTSSTSGLFWDLRTDNVSSWITSVAFLDSLNGFAVGPNGKIIKTADGGITWNPVSSPINRDFNEIIFIDPQQGVIVGGLRDSNFVSVQQTILKTTNGGQTWNVMIDTTGSWLTSVYFPDSDTGFAVGDSGTILKTVDGGDNWTPVLSPIQRDFNSVVFADANNGFIVGGNEDNDSIRTILSSDDGGNTWMISKDEPGGWLKDICFIDQNTCYAVGDDATLLQTIDGGQTWTEQPIDSARGTERFNTVEFLDHDFGIIAGQSGVALIYTISVPPEVQTVEAEVIDSTTAKFQGEVNTHGEPATYSFIFSRYDTIISAFETIAELVQSNAFTPVEETIPGLIPNTLYYNYVKAKTFAGTAKGDTLIFSTSTSEKIKTLLATEVKPTSAQLNGEISGFNQPVTLSFQYGTTQALENELPAFPYTVNDTSTQQISAVVSGLQTNTLYYYRLKAETDLGIRYYGNLKQVYVGASTIPNWDFQLWSDVDTFRIPVGWSAATGNVTRVPGHSGNYAIRLDNENLLLYGKFIDGEGPQFFDGTPFHYRPDSVSAYINYSIEPGDTAYMVTVFSGNGNLIAINFFPITGSSMGNFERKAFKLNYDLPQTPDSLVMGFLTTNSINDRSKPWADNYLIIDDLSFGPGAPAMPNAGFENWRAYPHQTLLGWNYSEFVFFDNLFNGSPPMVSRVLFDTLSDYAALIRNIEVAQGRFGGGNIRTSMQLFNDNVPAFPVYAMHQSLSGYFKFFPVGADTMQIMLEMFNEGNDIGTGSLVFTDSMTEFQPFEVPVNYNSAIMPDSANIIIEINGNHGPSRIIIDKLSFDGFYTSINEQGVLGRHLSWKIYPNPASDQLFVELQGAGTNKVREVAVVDLSGRVVFKSMIRTSGIKAGKSKVPLEKLQAGIYLVMLRGEDIFQIKKLVVSK